MSDVGVWMPDARFTIAPFTNLTVRSIALRYENGNEIENESESELKNSLSAATFQ